ncbi:hypothetical protein CKM354_001010000 [Cercospora kikuchii]|uniref:T6SS Phospholipase effector Tle1-like catalytic domain-containing protein n=1 Tax=Cercospora kikuchii TaxID=84275 RepID=A0A9P3FGT7_9PEZI|nr:uncharacterized protein CKM354_001010000 [Cercospora kikuchii]GIZ46998.1 hypothetical protein CKM354_001010000 [Cercospora kikuchii]
MLEDAYRWLCDHGATSSDKIVLAGFSEGAHAARVLVLMITDLGLVNQRYMELVDMMFEHWVGWREQENDAQANEGVRRLRAQFEHVLTYPLRVDTCAVFDTNATLGASSSYELTPSSNTKLRFGRKRIGTIRKVCHAMALDEDHTVFPVDLWEDQELWSLVRSRMRQCWFRGSHIDIGGDSNTVVSTIALMWMFVLLQGDPDLGLLFDTAKMIHIIQNNTVTANVGDLRRWKFESHGQRQRRPGRLSTERAHISARLLQERNLVETLKNSSGPWLKNNRWYWGFSIGGSTMLWEFDRAEYANIHGRDNGSVALEQYYLRMMGLMSTVD